MNNARMNPWPLVALAWTGVIFFSSTSLASLWCEEAFAFIGRTLFGHLQPSDSYYGIMHLLADKSVHVGLFLIFAMLLWKTLPGARWKVAAILLTGAFVGSCSEFLQRFFPGRDPAVRDVLINIGGTAVGVALSIALAHLNRAKRSNATPRTENEAVARLVD